MKCRKEFISIVLFIVIMYIVQFPKYTRNHPTFVAWFIISFKWPDKSLTSYSVLDFENDLENL